MNQKANFVIPTNVRLKDPREKEERQSDFLHAFIEIGSVTQTCKKVKMGRQTFYDWLETDEAFREQYEKAAPKTLIMLEDEAFRRAHNGVSKPVYQGGKKVGSVKEYSDTLMIVLLKARAPEKYKDRVSNEITGKGGSDFMPTTMRVEIVPPNPEDE